MWDDPSVQLRSVRFLGGITSPAIVLSHLALNKVIAHFCNSHWHMASLESIRVEFAQQSRDRFTGRLRVGVLEDCADHPSAIDSFPKRPFVGPTELPDVRTALPRRAGCKAARRVATGAWPSHEACFLGHCNRDFCRPRSDTLHG
jgi:hypothetical protein